MGWLSSRFVVDRVATGLLAGVAGTALMDLLWYGRYRRSGGRRDLARWVFSPAVESSDEAPASTRVARLITNKAAGSENSPRRAWLAPTLVVWGYGASRGALYGLLLSDRNGSVDRPLKTGALWGVAVWSSGYVTAPVVDVYAPIWRHDKAALGRDLSGHLVLGIGTASAFSAVHRANLNSLPHALAVLAVIVVP